MPRQSFSPTVKGPYHKAVGFAERGGSRSDALHNEEFILAHLMEELKSLRTGECVVGATTNIRAEYKSKSNLLGNEFLSETLHYLEHISARRGLSSHGRKDPRVFHPPMNEVKNNPEEAMIRDMCQEMEHNAKKGYINIEVNQGTPPPRQMNNKESKAHVVGLILAQMYTLRKGNKLFGEKAEQATMTELSKIDSSETYRPLHKHELSEQDRRDTLESMIKVTEMRADEVCVCVCVWFAVGNGSVPVGPAMHLVHPIRAPLPPQRAMWRGFGEARCRTIAGSDYPW